MTDLVKRLKDDIEWLKKYNLTIGIDSIIKNIEEAVKTLAPEPEFYHEQPVMASNSADFFSVYLLYYSHFKDGMHHCFMEGQTSRICRNTVAFKYCKPDYDAPTLPNWIPNTGVAPAVDLNKVVCELRDGDRMAGDRISTWVIRDCVSDVIKYLIIEG